MITKLLNIYSWFEMRYSLNNSSKCLEECKGISKNKEEK
nr:MAG TPA: hypothetical protein [Caudoviricetes sp.]